MGEHIEIQQPPLGKLFLIAAIELVEDGFLAMHHFVVAEGQQIPFVTGVEHGKGDAPGERRTVIGMGGEIT